MQMSFRYFGKDIDSVTLEQIRQIPGVKGVITTLYDIPVGEVWSYERIKEMKSYINSFDLEILGIESVNIHDDIKTGKNNRDLYIDNYITTLINLAKNDINLVCYNFMPVFDWTRSDLKKVRSDKSTVLAYDQKIIDSIDVNNIFSTVSNQSDGFILPGWEPDRLKRIKELFEEYKDIDSEKLFNNLVYFLKKIMPTCIKYNIKMAIHIDDPAWEVFGLSRIINNKENILRLMKAVDDPHNGVTFCSGSLGSNPNNDLVDIIHSLKGRIHFAHLRNIKYNAYKEFEEASHLSEDGSLDMYSLVKALDDIGFNGPIRPDHGRAIWGEVSMPGYGLYDRALGCAYLNGLIEAIQKNKQRR